MTKHMMKKIGNIIFYIFASILLMFIVLEIILPSKTMDILGFKGFVVVSPSMEPEIKVNDLVIVTKIEEENLSVGEIITFYTYLPTVKLDHEGNTIYKRSKVTHYIADFYHEDGKIIIKTKDYRKYHNDGSFDTWNDSNGDPVEITYDDVIGKVSFKVPMVGSIITFGMVLVQNPIFLGLIVLNIAIIVILIKYLKKPKEKPHDVG